MAESRLIGEYPVIGIRPTIDGRRGYLRVRESLEEQPLVRTSSKGGRGHHADCDALLVLRRGNYDMDPQTIKEVWGFNGTEILDDVREKLLRFGRSAIRSRRAGWRQ